MGTSPPRITTEASVRVGFYLLFRYNHPLIKQCLPVPRQGPGLLVDPSNAHILVLTTLEAVIPALPNKERLGYLLARAFITWEASIAVKMSINITLPLPGDLN